jgi:hypothetical protein
MEVSCAGVAGIGSLELSFFVLTIASCLPKQCFFFGRSIALSQARLILGSAKHYHVHDVKHIL